MGEGSKPGVNTLELSDAGTERLAIAIVKQACDDYEKVLRQLLRKPPELKKRDLLIQKAEQEAFFTSPHFDVLVTQTDGKALMRQIQKNAVTKEHKRVEEKLKKAKAKMAKKMAGQMDGTNKTIITNDKKGEEL